MNDSEKKVISSGGFIFYKDLNTGEVYVLLIKNPKGEYWIPKGKLEQGEDQQTAACREIKEEVGFGSDKVKYVDFCHLDQYQYEEDGKTLSKDLYINVFEADKKYEPAPEDWHNIEAIGWHKYDEALNLISFNKNELISSFEIFNKFKHSN